MLWPVGVSVPQSSAASADPAVAEGGPGPPGVAGGPPEREAEWHERRVHQPGGERVGDAPGVIDRGPGRARPARGVPGVVRPHGDQGEDEGRGGPHQPRGPGPVVRQRRAYPHPGEQPQEQHRAGHNEQERALRVRVEAVRAEQQHAQRVVPMVVVGRGRHGPDREQRGQGAQGEDHALDEHRPEGPDGPARPAPTRDAGVTPAHDARPARRAGDDRQTVVGVRECPEPRQVEAAAVAGVVHAERIRVRA
jgi:hypothetical protein